MCGICGVFFRNRSNHVAGDALAAMNRRIAHRGPDDEGFFREENVGLAMRRLSIIDVQSGKQPISNENGEVWIVFNGEIYNHSSLRAELEAKGHSYRSRSDTESIIHAYEEYGPSCVKYLQGMFAFAIWDRRKRTMFAVRDRFGIKPFYYTWDGKAFLFGSEIKAILAYPGIAAEFNHGTLAEYLAFGYITGSKTMFSGIRKLMPGHALEVSEFGDLTITRYWDLPNHSEAEQFPHRYYVEGYRDRLEAAVNSHLMSDVPLGMFLSGGLDSSAVAALATKLRRDRIKTFAVGYGSEDSGEKAFSELPSARQVAAHIGSDHHEVYLSRDDFFATLPRLIWHEDEPIAWPSSVSLYFVARLAREHVTVVLTGEGSDETLAGYTRYAWTLLNSRMDSIYRSVTTTRMRRIVRDTLEASPFPSSVHRKLGHTFVMRNGSSWQSFYYDNFFSAFSDDAQDRLLTRDTRAMSGEPYATTMAIWEQSPGDLLQRLLHSDIQTYLVELLMKQDQMSMAASIESRVPFLDHELAQFAVNIPTQHSISGMNGKMILKIAVADLLPKSIIYRNKMGFPTPWEHWLRGKQLDDTEKFLLAPRSIRRGLFRPEAVKTLFEEHRRKVRDHGNRIWRLLNLELWQRVYLDGEALENIHRSD